MAGKKRIVISDDQVLVDMELVFKAIREEKGNWQKVEAELKQLMESMRVMGEGE